MYKNIQERKLQGLCVNCPKKITSIFTRCEPCRLTNKKSGALRTRKYKEVVIEAYGGKCICCNETTFEFLTIDHSDGNGVAHKKLVGGTGGHMYRWLIKNNFPQVGFQLLCFNCNCAKGFSGYCPHNRI